MPVPATLQLRNYGWVAATQEELGEIHARPGFELPTRFGELPRVRDTQYPWPSTGGVTLDKSRRQSAAMFKVPPSFKKHGLAPGTWHSFAKASTGEVLYDLEIKIDSLGRRETPNPDAGRRTRYLMSLGCSFTYGEGMRETETLPARLALRAPGYHVYNYGRPGDGPFDVLSLLEDMDRKEHIKERDGAAIYLYFSDHIRRMIPSIDYWVDKSQFGRGGWDVPYYEAEGGELRRHEGFASVHPFLAFFYEALAHSNVLAYYELNVPSKFGIDDYRKAARVMRGMRDAYERKFGNDRFYVVLFPEGWETPLPRLLEEAGVKFLNYERFNLDHYTKGKPTIHALDGHPSAEANAILARVISEDLHLAGGTPP